MTGSPDIYAYVGGDPVGFVDPLGLQSPGGKGAMGGLPPGVYGIMPDDPPITLRPTNVFEELGAAAVRPKNNSPLPIPIIEGVCSLRNPYGTRDPVQSTATFAR